MTDLRKAAEMALGVLEEINKLSIGENAVCLPGEIDDAMEALRQALAEPEQEPLVWMNKYGHVASFKNEEYTDLLYTIPVEYKAEIERLHKEVEHLRQAYHRVKTENEKLSLDLGIKNKDFR